MNCSTGSGKDDVVTFRMTEALRQVSILEFRRPLLRQDIPFFIESMVPLAILSPHV